MRHRTRDRKARVDENIPHRTRLNGGDLVSGTGPEVSKTALSRPPGAHVGQKAMRKAHRGAGTSSRAALVRSTTNVLVFQPPLILTVI